MRLHAGELPFKCRYCDIRFKHSSGRQVHEKDEHIPPAVGPDGQPILKIKRKPGRPKDLTLAQIKAEKLQRRLERKLKKEEKDRVNASRVIKRRNRKKKKIKEELPEDNTCHTDNMSNNDCSNMLTLTPLQPLQLVHHQQELLHHSHHTPPPLPHHMQLQQQHHQDQQHQHHQQHQHPQTHTNNAYSNILINHHQQLNPHLPEHHRIMVPIPIIQHAT